MKTILVTGAGGQLGTALCRNIPAGFSVQALNRQSLDIADRHGVAAYLRENAIHGIINAAAYTLVDKAESEISNAEEVNAVGPAVLSEMASRYGIHLVHVSTDFVFDGGKGKPYLPDDKTNPLSVYGRTKRDGEVAVLGTENLSATIIRTAWVYDLLGSNFVTTMLRLMAERDTLGVVADQVGSPTHVDGLAAACWECLSNETNGVRHWTDAGVASWYDFAVAIQEEAFAVGVLHNQIPIKPLTTEQYPTPATRPSYSVLSNSGDHALIARPRHWRKVLRTALESRALDA